MRLIEWIVIIILLIAIFFLFSKYSNLKGNVEDRSRYLFEDWKQRELSQIKVELDQQSNKSAQLLFQEWIKKEEERIRKDAINKSRSVIIGKVTEHLVPFFPGFKYNPKDVRFIGTPIDILIFDGLDEGNIRKIIFGEIKTGKYGNLTPREKSIKRAIENKDIGHEIIHIGKKDDIDIYSENDQKLYQEDDILQIPHVENKENVKKIQDD